MDTYPIGRQPVRQPALTWMILFSAAAHVLLVVGLGVAPYFKPRRIFYTPTYMVSLVNAGDLEGEQPPPAPVRETAPAKPVPPPPKPKPKPEVKAKVKKPAVKVSKPSKDVERPKKPAMQLRQEGKEKASKPPPVQVKSEPAPQSSYSAALSQIKKRLAERSGQGEGGGGRRGRLTAAGPGIDLTPYDAVLAEVVRSNWIKPETLAHLDEDLVAVVVLRIRRSGAIAYFEIDESSGNEHFDDSIRRVLNKVVFPPLPAAYPGEFYERHLRFHSAFITRAEGVGVETGE